MKVELNRIGGRVHRQVDAPFARPIPCERTSSAACRSRSPTVDRTYDDYHWWIVRDDDGEVVGIAMRTSPFNMIDLVRCPETPRVRSGAALGEFDDGLPGLSGSTDIIDALVEGYVDVEEPRLDACPRRATSGPPLRAGRTRRAGRRRHGATGAQRRDASCWRACSCEFTDEASVPSMSLAEAHDAASIGIRDSSLFCWEVDGDGRRHGRSRTAGHHRRSRHRSSRTGLHAARLSTAAATAAR